MKPPAIDLRWFDRYLDDYCLLREHMNYQPSSIAAARRDLTLFSQYCHGRHLRAIRGKTILDFFTYVKTTRGNCSGSINRKRASLCTYLRHLQLRQVPGADTFPTKAIPRARDAYSGPIQVPERKEVLTILDGFDKATVIGLRDSTLFTLIYFLGLRLGEILAINLEDIDWRRKILTIHGKGRKKRKLPLVPQVVLLIKQWLTYRECLNNSDLSPALFLSLKGNRLSSRAAEENFQKVIAKAGPFTVKKITPHTLRHAFASHALETGQDVVVLKAILGHARLQTTELYLHPSIDMQRKAITDHLASDILREIRANEKPSFRMRHHTTKKAVGFG